MSQHHTSDSTNSFNNNIINSVWNNYKVNAEKPEILAWLSTLKPQSQHQDIQTRRVDEVRDWLLQTQEYRNWSCDFRGGKSDWW